jgi:hypothetical protein
MTMAAYEKEVTFTGTTPSRAVCPRASARGIGGIGKQSTRGE